MSDVRKVDPDLSFIRGVMENGGEDLKKCYQCATCSVVCDLSPDDRPFPRKEMIWAQWGLKEKLAADPDIWLCHQCNDCTTHCPRDARPGDVISAIRHQFVIDHAVPKFLAQWANSTKMLPVMLAIPALLLCVALAIRGPVKSVLGFLDHDPSLVHWEYAELFPHSLLIFFFTGFSILAFLAVAVGVMRFWNAMKKADEDAGRKPTSVGLIGGSIKVLKQVFTHNQFNQCSEQKERYVSHLGVFYGFIGLLLVTLWAILALYVLMPLISHTNEWIAYPFVWWNPVKIFANISGIALLVGCIRMMLKRSQPGSSAGGSQFDWLFVWLLLGVVVTGFFVQFFRFPVLDMKEIGFAIYFVHLVLVFNLLMFLPYSKFAHLVYRTVALVYAEVSGRNMPAPQAVAGAAASEEAGKEQAQASPAD